MTLYRNLRDVPAHIFWVTCHFVIIVLQFLIDRLFDNVDIFSPFVDKPHITFWTENVISFSRVQFLSPIGYCYIRYLWKGRPLVDFCCLEKLALSQRSYLQEMIYSEAQVNNLPSKGDFNPANCDPYTRVNMEDSVKLKVIERKFMRWLNVITRGDRITKTSNRTVSNIDQIGEVIECRKLKWYWHVRRREKIPREPLLTLQFKSNKNEKNKWKL